MIVRRATVADVDLLYRWRTDSGTQEFSAHSSEIDSAGHREWVEKVSERRDCYRRDCYLAIVEASTTDGVVQPIGTFRLDNFGTRAVEVSITIAPEWRGHRLATPVIEAAVARAFQVRQTERVIALIHERNARSRAAFERARFRLSAEPMGGREKFFVYVRERS